MKSVQSVTVSTLALLALAGAASAQDIIRPGDTITGFPVNWPGGEAPERCIDNSGDSKYLNFAKLNTGFIVTPTGTGIVRGISITTANDAPERDPASFVIEGSNDEGATWSPIATGNLNAPTTRRALAQALFSNTATYSQYRVTFPTVRTEASANSMQVGEVRLITAGNILTNGDPFTVTYPAIGFTNANEGPANLFDGRTGTKLGIFNGNSGPTFIDVTPAQGASIVTGITIFGGGDDGVFQNRTPTYVTLSGSNDGVTFTQITTSELQQLNINYSEQQLSFANTASYSRFRLELGPSIDGFLQIGELVLHGVAGPALPANDNCTGALPLVAGANSGANFNATGTDITDCGVGDSADVWFSYTPDASGLVEVNTFGPGTLNTTLAVYGSCGGAALGCDDNTRAGLSRVRWTATAGVSYKIRVAGANGATGAFTLNVDTAPLTHSDVFVPMAYNFNGMVHAGEADAPDAPNGFRSIVDRALRVTGEVGSIEVGLESSSSIPYSVVTQAGVLDLVHLGDRNTNDNANYPFETEVPGLSFDRGIQPTWLPNSDQRSTPQLTPLTGLSLAMGADTKIGVLYHATNGGTNFTMSLEFTDDSSTSVTLNAPDWFGDQDPTEPVFGVDIQRQLGLYNGSGGVDSGRADVDLNVVEAVVSTAGLNNAGLGDYTGKQLRSISFSNPTSTVAATAIFAVTIRDGVSVSLPCLADVVADGTIDGTDFIAFINSFAIGDAAVDATADVAGGTNPGLPEGGPDGTIDGTDFIAFINAFAVGC